MTTLKTLRLQYGQITMQYEVQHCTLREHEDADPEMVGPYTYITSPHHLAPTTHILTWGVGWVDVCVCVRLCVCVCVCVQGH